MTTRIDTTRFCGPFRLHKAEQARPRRLHPTFEAAESEAVRLIEQNPGDTFVISQEVARVGELRPPQTHKGRGRGAMPIPADQYLAGRSLGSLTFVEERPSRPIDRGDGRRFIRMGLFACGCGGSIVAELRNVKRGLTQSCGCLLKASDDA